MRTLGEPTAIVVHHSASRRMITLNDLHQWHVIENEWPRIGYPFFIDGHARLHTPSPLHLIGYHCPPNKGRIGICVAGNNCTRQSRWVQPQVDELRCVLEALWVIYPHLEDEVYGHRDLSGKPTDCPGIDIRSLVYRDDFTLPWACVW